MLIRSFENVKDLYNNGLRSCGILKYKRNICVLVDPSEYRNGTTRRGKAVIINESISKGSKEGNMMHIAVDNSVIIRVSVYFCNIIFEIPNNVRRSQLTIENAYSNEYQSLFDNNTTAIYLTGNYSKVLDKLEAISPETYNDIVNNMDTAVIPPLYYTEKHQFSRVNDIFCMGGATIETYGGGELIDNQTKITFTDINFWDSMKLRLLGIMKYAERNSGDTCNIANLLYHDFSRFAGEESLFIYDSDAYGINRPGSNILGGDVPFKSYYAPSYLPNNVNTALTLFEQTCHDIESNHGHIRVMCYPGRIGNKVRIKFKDYASFPSNTQPLGDINEDGGSSSFDTGYHIEKEITEAIDACNTQ